MYTDSTRGKEKGPDEDGGRKENKVKGESEKSKEGKESENSKEGKESEKNKEGKESEKGGIGHNNIRSMTSFSFFFKILALTALVLVATVIIIERMAAIKSSMDEQRIRNPPGELCAALDG